MAATYFGARGSNQGVAAPFADPNPIPTETDTRYISPTGSAGNTGTTSGSPWNWTKGMDWIENTAVNGGTLRLLPGIYPNATHIFNNPRPEIDSAGTWRVIRSDDLSNPAIIQPPSQGYGFYITQGSNRKCFYGLEFDGRCSWAYSGVWPLQGGNGPSDGAYSAFNNGVQGNIVAGQPEWHHTWIKQCVAHNFYSTGMLEGFGYGTDPARPRSSAAEFLLVEDCEIYDNAWGAPWGGSGLSALGFQQSTKSIDPMFQFPIDGVNKTWGFIFRRNIGYRNFQRRSNSGTHPYTGGNYITDGNFLTTDYMNALDFDTTGSDYNRALLIENNIGFGNGRFYAGTATHPANGLYLRFNTSSHDGITYRHEVGSGGPSLGAYPIGGYGHVNDSCHYHGNVIVYDPAMSHPDPYPGAIFPEQISKDYGAGYGSTGSLASSDWNLTVPNGAGYGEAFPSSGGTNPVHTDPGLGDPPAYLTVGARIDRTVIKNWATPAAGSSVVQASSPYTPTDGVDLFWTPNDGTHLGAVVAGS